MPTTIHLVRHAQGFHNLTTANHSLPDPLLTPHGLEQCRALSQTFPSPTSITHLVSSPLRRTLYTTLYSFPSVVSRGVKVVALPEIQETSDLPCDTGSDVGVLREEFDAGEFKGMVDLGLVKEGWNDKTGGRFEPSSGAIQARAREARVWLRGLGKDYEGEGDVNVVVVTHGGFLHYFTEDVSQHTYTYIFIPFLHHSSFSPPQIELIINPKQWEDSAKFSGTGWENTEFRSYRFVDEKGDDANASVKETRESRERRNGSEKELTREEQENLRRVTEDSWGGGGLLSEEEGKK
ncbi:Histidine phosphatase superfamily clade-1 protein [Rutstroemia sp. NJR-2017a BVV2]|nr:Histidine phosphatase superfamily clade-1 protein [Rutstroemia sp. NJR-2017a BVV2]